MNYLFANLLVGWLYLNTLFIRLMSETLDVLIQHSEVMLVDTMMSTQSDIPEKCLCSALSFYLQ